MTRLVEAAAMLTCAVLCAMFAIAAAGAVALLIAAAVWGGAELSGWR